MTQWVTFAEAIGQSPYELARHWADLPHRPLGDAREPAAELHEIATMAALRDWLTRWLPIPVHAALLAGASVPEVAAALDVPPGAVRVLWAQWADGQVRLWQTSRPEVRLGVSPDHAARVRAVLDTFDARGGDDRG